MKNQVIEVLTREHGEHVIQYWKDKGINTRQYRGRNTKAAGNSARYYGVINGRFGSYKSSKVEAAGAEIIELPDVSRPVPTEIHEALARIESKLDQLLATPADADDKQEKPDEQDVEINPGDRVRVRVKSWKEIKAMTTKDEDGDRVFNDEGYFTKHDKQFCGMDGVVISTGRLYVTTEIDGKNICLHYKSLEKIQP